MKIAKYGKRVLETIEATIREHYKDKSSSSSNDSNDSKRRRDAMNNISVDDDFSQSTARSKKRFVHEQNKISESFGHAYPALDEFDDLDFDDDLFNVEVSGGRVLPSWSTGGNKVHG